MNVYVLVYIYVGYPVMNICPVTEGNNLESTFLHVTSPVLYSSALHCDTVF